jgi:hypothetical protein
MLIRLAVPLLLLTVSGAKAQIVANSIVNTVPNEPITAEQRLAWFANTAVSPANTLGSLASAGLDTLRNSPAEYGPHWAGFGQRYGLRLSERAVEGAFEAGIGALWGEDPRYNRVPERPFGARVGHVFKMTFVTHDRNGHEMPAYARFVAAPATAFASNLWVPDSQHSTGDALNRTATIFANQMIGNALSEFWPDVRRRLFRRHNPNTDPVTAPPSRR